MAIVNKQTARRGVTMFEVAVAAAILALFLATSVRMMAAIAHSERGAQRRAIAQLALDNLAEELQAMPAEPRDNLLAASAETAPGDLASARLPEDVMRRLPVAELTIAASDETDPAALRIAFELTWKNRHRGRSRPARLTIWVFPSGGEIAS